MSGRAADAPATAAAPPVAAPPRPAPAAAAASGPQMAFPWLEPRRLPLTAEDHA